MRLEKLTKITAKRKKRVGRGASSGKGTTAGRGTKGQKSRAGYNLPRRFEGGQTALIARIPKARGFKSAKIKPVTISIETIEAKFNDGDKVNFKTLIEKNILKKMPAQGVKIVGGGKLTKKISFSQVKLSKSVLKIVESMPQSNQAAKSNQSPSQKSTRKKAASRKSKN